MGGVYSLDKLYNDKNTLEQKFSAIRTVYTGEDVLAEDHNSLKDFDKALLDYINDELTIISLLNQGLGQVWGDVIQIKQQLPLLEGNYVFVSGLDIEKYNILADKTGFNKVVSASLPSSDFININTSNRPSSNFLYRYTIINSCFSPFVDISSIYSDATAQGRAFATIEGECVKGEGIVPNGGGYSPLWQLLALIPFHVPAYSGLVFYLVFKPVYVATPSNDLYFFAYVGRPRVTSQTDTEIRYTKPYLVAYIGTDGKLGFGVGWYEYVFDYDSNSNTWYLSARNILGRCSVGSSPFDIGKWHVLALNAAPPRIAVYAIDNITENDVEYHTILDANFSACFTQDELLKFESDLVVPMYAYFHGMILLNGIKYWEAHLDYVLLHQQVSKDSEEEMLKLMGLV